MNKKQKIIIISGAVIIIIAFIIWGLSGGEVFTKTQVLVEKKDELFGTTYKEWQNKFIWGLDLTGAVTAFVIIVCGILIYVFKSREKK